MTTSDSMPGTSDDAGVELLEVHTLRLVETAAPRISPEHQAAMDSVWDRAVQANPTLFDGPAVVCAGLERDGKSLVLSWVRATYRHFALRRVPGASPLPSTFVTVAQPTDDGRLLVGRMSPSTAAPGRWQLPGGNIEPPDDHQVLDAAALRRQAARELIEETGIDTAPDDLTLWAITRGEHGNVGFQYLAPPLSATVLHARFADLVSSEVNQGREPELDRIALVRSPDTLADLDGPHVDYLAPVLVRYANLTPGSADE